MYRLKIESNDQWTMERLQKIIAEIDLIQRPEIEITISAIMEFTDEGRE
jgi:hypothetical protein